MNLQLTYFVYISLGNLQRPKCVLNQKRTKIIINWMKRQNCANIHTPHVLLASLSFGQGRRRSTTSVSLCWVCVGAHWKAASARTSVVLCVFSVGKGVLSLPQEKRLHSQALDMLNSHMNVDKSIRAPSKHSGPFLLAWEAEVKGTRGGRGEVDKLPWKGPILR